MNKNGVETVDLFSAFAAERKNDPVAGDSLYLARDTHWRARGARLAAHLVAEHVKQYPWYVPGTTSYAIDSVIIDRTGDIGVMTTLPSIKLHDLTMGFPTEKTKCYQVYSVDKGDSAETPPASCTKTITKIPRCLSLGIRFRVFTRPTNRAPRDG